MQPAGAADGDILSTQTATSSPSAGSVTAPQSVRVTVARFHQRVCRVTVSAHLLLLATRGSAAGGGIPGGCTPWTRARVAVRAGVEAKPIRRFFLSPLAPHSPSRCQISILQYNFILYVHFPQWKKTHSWLWFIMLVVVLSSPVCKPAYQRQRTAELRW